MADRLREEIAQLFESAWQDGVHHLNPKYLIRTDLFTDRVLELINQSNLALLDELEKQAVKVMKAENLSWTDLIKAKKFEAVPISAFNNKRKELTNDKR